MYPEYPEFEEVFLVLNTLAFAFGVEFRGSKLFRNLELELLEFISICYSSFLQSKGMNLEKRLDAGVFCWMHPGRRWSYMIKPAGPHTVS